MTEATAKRSAAILAIARRVVLPLAGVAALGLLSACAGGAGGSGGTINIGSGQSTDPATVDFPVAYVKRTIPKKPDDLREIRDTTPDADLWVRDRASPSATERNVTDRVTGTKPYDIRDVDVNFEGTKFIFAMRGPLATNQKEDDPPTWEIWEYEIKTDTLHRVIASDTIAAEGNDVGPHYLPDGRIVFSSTRQRQSQAILRDEGKPGFEAQNEENRRESSFLLHVMKADGSDMHQVSFNQSSDRDASVLANGRLLWTRWEGASGRGMHLYTSNPDGSDLQLLYGARSHDTGSDPTVPVQFVHAREMQDGHVLALVRPFGGTGQDVEFGGDLTIIDTKDYVENTQAVAASAGLTGPAQVRATRNDVRTVPGPSPGGRFNSAFPLWDGSNRILVTWSQCRLLENAVVVPCTDARLAAPTPVLAPVLYSAFIFNPTDNTLKPLFEPAEGVMVTDLVAAQPRTLPSVILDKVAGLDFDSALQSDGVGILDIRSVYDFDGAQPNGTTIGALAQAAAANRPARFLRIQKAVSLPDRDVLDIDNTAFGASNFMREILGYIPIEPDGSVRARVPANVAFRIDVLDANGRRLLPDHRNWLQLRAGETKTCNGCHANNTTPEKSHGRDGLSASAWAGAASTGVAFPGTVPAFSPNAGETMAQTRCRYDNCSSSKLSVNLVFTDVWTNTTVRAKDPDLVYAYDGTVPVAPTATSCITTWASTCRIVINYVKNIHPLWSKPRQTLAGDGVTVLTDHTCTLCHSERDAANAPRAAAGQLDLSDGDSDEVPTRKRAYQELLFPDTARDVTMGALTDTGTAVSPSLVAGNARGSTRFFDRFAPAGDHAGFLSPAELRLLSEWVDIGAQYFNNPFDPLVPLN